MKAIPDPLSDEELMLRMCAAKDRATADELFCEIFERYRIRVASWCYRIARDRDAACDLAQEVFLKAWRYRHTFRGDSRLSTWLFAITRNHCLTAAKKHRNDPVQIEDTLRARVRDHAAVEPDRAAESSELYRRLLQLMVRTLDPLEARVMTLHYVHEVPLAVITRNLALANPSGAKAYIVNARRKLQGTLRRRGWKLAVTASTGPIPPWWQEEAA